MPAARKLTVDVMRRRNPDLGKIPTIELIPMLNVMMGILAFFVMVSAILIAEKGVDVSLAGGENQPPPSPAEALPDPLIVNLNAQGDIVINSQSTAKEQMFADMQAYLGRYAKGVVLLQADRGLDYATVVDLLGEMQRIGGNRVSLVLDDPNAPPPAAAPAVPSAPVAPAAAPPAAPAEDSPSLD